MHAPPSLVWLRQDLRLDDHVALQAAIQRGGPVIPVFIWSLDKEGEWGPGGASRWWLHQSLTHLVAALRQCGSRLVIRQGDSLSVLRALQHETGAAALFWNGATNPPAEHARCTFWRVEPTTPLASGQRAGAGPGGRWHDPRRRGLSAAALYPAIDNRYMLTERRYLHDA